MTTDWGCMYFQIAIASMLNNMNNQTLIDDTLNVCKQINFRMIR